ncbi:MAG: hypothetical protein C0433_12355 [Cyclobacterium sp.]|nr:hypothetical protein [Cyclobacterium sp.]
MSLYFSESLDDEGKTVLEYLLSETLETKFQTANYERLYTLFKEMTSKSLVSDLKSLLSKFPNEKKSEIIDLIQQKWEISPHWTGRHGILVPTEKDNLVTSSYRAIIWYKKRYVEKLMSEASQNIKSAEMNKEDFDRVLILQSIYLEVKKVQMLLSKELSIVYG